MGYCPYNGVESRYSRLYRDTRRTGVHSGIPRHDAVGLRHGPAIRPARPTTRLACVRPGR